MPLGGDFLRQGSVPFQNKPSWKQLKYKTELFVFAQFFLGSIRENPLK
jgi:hypothetical protein